MTVTDTKPVVLVVDDEPRILNSISDLLDEDFTVLTSTDAEAALQMVASTHISVIIADQRMPGLSGDQFLAKAKELSEATRILITGYADINALIRAVNHGQIYTYVPKPWESLQLKITVVKAAEHCRLAKQLMRERHLLHTLMDNVPDAIWFKDSAGRFARVNNALLSFLGLQELSAVIGRADGNFVPLDSLVGRGKSSSEAPAVMNKIHELRGADGSLRWVSTTQVPVMEDRESVVAFVGVARDITAEKRTEEALRQSEAKYRRIVETAEEGVWILDERHTTIFVNRKMASMLGCSSEEAPGRRAAEFMLQEDIEPQLRKLEDCGSGASTVDLRLRRTDGTILWTILAGSPLLEESGRRIGTLGMFTDITERRSLENQFLQAQKLEAVGRLAGGVAHDFNNVLTLVTGHSQLLLRQLDADSPLRRHVEKIQKAGDRAAGLSRQLLTFSRQRSVQHETLDLNRVVVDLQKLLQPLLGDDIELTTRLEPELGLVRADAGQIEQVLMNLVVNARDAMPLGGRLTIDTANVGPQEAISDCPREIRQGLHVMLAVSDSGCGMDAETKAHIFEPFFTTKPVGKGTGLGLSTVHGIVGQAGGSISVSSEPERGTTFRIFLPRVDAELAQSRPEQQSADEPSAAGTILVVEDQEAVRELMREILAAGGYDVLEARDGQEAIEVSEKHAGSIDLVVTDLIMPRMRGSELARIVKIRRPDTKVLYVSGYSGDALAGEESEPQNELLPKPFTPEDLLRKVRANLSTSRD